MMFKNKNTSFLPYGFYMLTRKTLPATTTTPKQTTTPTLNRLDLLVNFGNEFFNKINQT